jgi:hypothetical protein
VIAQGYNENYYDDNSYYSQYPTDDKKYECRTGPFEGFFVSSVEFCKHVKFDDKRDHRDNINKTGTPGTPGPVGPQGPPGPQGPAGPSEINATNLYTVIGNTSNGAAFLGIVNLTSIATCDIGDFATGGGFEKSIGPNTSITGSKPLATENGWNVTASVFPVFPPSPFSFGSVTANAVCFDNRPLRP